MQTYSINVNVAVGIVLELQRLNQLWYLILSAQKLQLLDTIMRYINLSQCAHCFVFFLLAQNFCSTFCVVRGRSRLNGVFHSVVQVKGQGIYAFVTLLEGVEYSDELRRSLIFAVRKQVLADGQNGLFLADTQKLIWTECLGFPAFLDLSILVYLSTTWVLNREILKSEILDTISNPLNLKIEFDESLAEVERPCSTKHLI